MKRQKLTRKLALSRKTVANLDNGDMQELKGGARETFYPVTCKSLNVNCGTAEMCSCVYSQCR